MSVTRRIPVAGLRRSAAGCVDRRPDSPPLRPEAVGLDEDKDFAEVSGHHGATVWQQRCEDFGAGQAELRRSSLEKLVSRVPHPRACGHCGRRRPVASAFA
jgi:hypothetical protein